MSLDPLKATKAIEENTGLSRNNIALNDNELHQELVVELKARTVF